MKHLQCPERGRNQLFISAGRKEYSASSNLTKEFLREQRGRVVQGCVDRKGFSQMKGGEAAHQMRNKKNQV